MGEGADEDEDDGGNDGKGNKYSNGVRLLQQLAATTGTIVPTVGSQGGGDKAIAWWRQWRRQEEGR